MKDIYVNKEGVICACTVEVPVKPKFIDDAYHIEHCINQRNRSQYESNLKACKDSAVPFDDTSGICNLLHDQLAGPFSSADIKPDTFYQIDVDWKIVEVPEEDSGTDEIGRKVDFKKVARLKVPAPTVATDNSGEKPNLLQWLKDERNVLQNTGSLMWHKPEEQAKTLATAKALSTTIQYIELSEIASPVEEELISKIESLRLEMKFNGKTTFHHNGQLCYIDEFLLELTRKS